MATRVLCRGASPPASLNALPSQKHNGGPAAADAGPTAATERAAAVARPPRAGLSQARSATVASLLGPRTPFVSQPSSSSALRLSAARPRPSLARKTKTRSNSPRLSSRVFRLRHPKDPPSKEKATVDLPEEDLRQILRSDKACPLLCAQQAALELQAELDRRAAVRHEARTGWARL